MAIASYLNEFPGAMVTNLYGPSATASSIPQPQFKLGVEGRGDRHSRYVFCALVLGSTTTLLNGQAYTIDKDFNASLVTTTNSPRGTSVGFGSVSRASVPAGTYWLWLQVQGNCGVQFTGSANALAESTATGGLLNFTNTPTTGAKTIVGAYLYQATSTFTANTTSGTAVLSGVSSLNDVAVGATVTGTGIPASTTVVSFGVTNGDNQIVLSANATATGSAITVTQIGVQVANLSFPYIDKTN